MVLQRAPKSARIWGWAQPGTVVRVALNGEAEQHSVSDTRGEWSVTLPPQSASHQPRTILITNGDSDAKMLSNVIHSSLKKQIGGRA